MRNRQETRVKELQEKNEDGRVRIMYRNQNYLQELPPELLQIILCYYTNSLSGLFLFRTTCIQCFQAVEVSLLWLTADLSFYPPRDYIPNQILGFPYSNASIQMFDSFTYWSISEKITLKPPKYSTQRKAISEIQSINYSQEILKIKEFTFKVIRKYNELWHWRIKWQRIVSKIHIFFHTLTSGTIGFLIRAFAFIGSILSVYFISKTPNFPHGKNQTIHGQLGFFFLYFVGISLTIWILKLLIDKIHHLIKFAPGNDLESPIITIQNLMLPLIYFFVDLGIFFTIIFTQIKFSLPVTSSFPYIYLSLPLWIFWGIAFTLIISHWSFFQNPKSRLSFAWNSMYLMIAVPSTITYFALFYDQQLPSSSFSLVYGILPILPLQIGGMYWLPIRIRDCYRLGRTFFLELLEMIQDFIKRQLDYPLPFLHQRRNHLNFHPFCSELFILLGRVVRISLLIYFDLLILAASDRRFRHRSYFFSLLKINQGSVGEVLQCLVCLLVEYQLSCILK